MSMDLTYLLSAYKISNTSKVVYGLLDGLSRASMANGKPYVWISRKSIAERCNVCVKTAIKAIGELKAVGLIAEKRMGQGLNNHIFVFLPKMKQEEKKKTMETANHSIYNSRVVNNSIPYNRTEKVISNSNDLSIVPANENKGQTARKGKPTPRMNVGERQRIRKLYRDYFRKCLKYEEYKRDFLTSFEDVEALAKIIDLMANAMSSKGKIMVNGALIMPQQWFYAVKNIEQEQVLDIIAKIPHMKNIRKPQAYLLACLYNSAIQETLIKPWAINGTVLH